MLHKNKVILVIADGWGIAPAGPGNYISFADTHNFDGFLKKYPHCENEASGLAVGLPNGAQGNSEVGHLHMGAGRIVWQMFQRINNAVKNRTFFGNEVLLNAIEYAKKNDSRLHLMGLCSDEGVHAHTDHLLALMEMAKEHGVNDVFIHFYADGRDVAEKSARKYVDMIENKAREIGVGKIGTVIGRYYSMDRDTNWDRTERAYRALVQGIGFKAKCATQAIEDAYKRGDKTDYYIQPTVIVDDTGEPIGTIKDNDSVLFFNFRTDRPRQLVKAFVLKDFDGFKRDIVLNVMFTTMTKYDKTIECPAAFREHTVENNLGQVIAKHGLKQLRLAETEKYAHVTYFFNSLVEEPNEGEERIMIPSAKVASYDEKPEMSAYEIASVAVNEIQKKKFDFILMNFANCDLVGHSAVKEAIIKCVRVVDVCLDKIVRAGLENGYVIVVTADHGSAEDKLYPDGEPKPAHSTNHVPFIVISDDERLKKIKLKNGGQKDVAPTVLDIMGLEKPQEMTGDVLIL